MIFPNEILVKKQSNDNINHPPATTGLDRPSSFYDKTLSEGFKAYYSFDGTTKKTQYRVATTGLDRPSSFYNKTLSDGFRKNFKFVSPESKDKEQKVLLKKYK